MTKKELFDLLVDMPDDAVVYVDLHSEGVWELDRVEIDKAENTITLSDL